MGHWLNVAFVQATDLHRVRREIAVLVGEAGRLVVRPAPRIPAQYDPMQYGKGDEVDRWGVAGFPGAPGWIILRTAPFELLMQGKSPLLCQLAGRLGVPAFQYNVYDGDSHFLLETDGDGRVERSGFVGSEPSRYWDADPPEDRCGVRFRIIAPDSAAACSEASMPETRVRGRIPSYRRPAAHASGPRSADIEQMWNMMETRSTERRVALLRWLEETHGDVRDDGTWSHHPSHVVRALARYGDEFLSIEGATDDAIVTVFGGANREHCDNVFLVQSLVPHTPLPVDGFALYAERT